MIRVNIQGYNLDVLLERCVHRCFSESAVGKTAIARIALDDPGYQGFVRLCSKKSDYERLLSEEYVQSENEILVLDRVDFFGCDVLWRFIEQHSNDCILVDAKTLWLAHVDYLYTFYTMSVNKLVVRDTVTRGM